MSLLEDFFSDKPNDLATFQAFDKRQGLSFITRLRGIQDRNIFLATITEIHFGIFFESLGANLFYNKKIFSNSGLTPDWTIELNGQQIITDVFRLNANSIDQDTMNFESELIAVLEEIEKPYFVSLSFDIRDIDEFVFSIGDFKKVCQNWLNEPRAVGDYIKTQHIKVKIGFIHSDSKHVGVAGTFHPINSNHARLTGSRSQLFLKVNKYGPLARQQSLPFIPCAYLDFHSWFDEKDIFHELYGRPADFIHHEPFGEYFPGAKFHVFDKGLYYNDAGFKKLVSGIIIRKQNTFTFFPNFSNSSLLNTMNKNALSTVRFNGFNDLGYSM
jgi:hypothetical protein